jgi:lipopolysaccharide/colanic/teichoic acid biosynthesis glycosyltransferase
VKRLLDVGLASAALVVLSPLFLVVAILIRLESPGPVFYAGVRCGRHRRPFRFYKFRTMVAGADRLGPTILTTVDDPRVTRLGHVLRRFKIDELPQLVNVLRGDMSLVGPRPEVPDVVNRYHVERWDRVLSVRPGITCLLQIDVYPEFSAALEGVADPIAYYVEHQLPYKLARDLEYVERRSLRLDLTIIARTLACILLKSRVPRSPARAEGHPAPRSAAVDPAPLTPRAHDARGGLSWREE